MTYFEYPKCSTCKNIKQHLIGKNIEFISRDIVLNTPTYEEIKAIHENSNKPIKKFFNTSGLKYKELNLKDKISSLTLDEIYHLLSSDGMLIKRPFLVDNKSVYIAREILEL